jgi:anti-sigma B factor antagonist
MSVTCTARVVDGTAVVTLEGDIDLENSERVRDALLARLAARHDVVVDLGRLRHIDSAGVAGLIEAHHAALVSGVRFSLAAVNRAVLKVLELVRLDKVFVIYPDVDAALAAG